MYFPLIFKLQQFKNISAVFLVMFLCSVATLTAQAPSSILPDIINFKIQYPLDENGDDYTGVAWEDRGNPLIKNEKENNLSGYIASEPYLDYFYVEGNEVIFKAHCAGALTSANAYPRCELRERPNGTDSYWNFTDEQELNATFRVTHLPDVKQEVCMLQIKGSDGNSNEEAFRLEYRANSNQGLHLAINETTTLNDIMPYSLGETIEARLYVNNGDITVELTNTSTGDIYFHQYASAYPLGYFKAGCYTQSSIWEEKNNVGDELPTAYGEVRFSSLELGVQTFLPVELTYFGGAFDERKNQVTLTWRTASEINNSGFQIERTLNPNDGFEPVGWVDGRGTTNLLSEYNFEDQSIENGKRYYYRLQQMDRDGQTEFSEIITIQTTPPDNNWQAFPNPVQDIVTIRSTQLAQAVTGLIQIVDTQGKVVFEETHFLERDEEIKLRLGYLSTGVYTLLISNTQGEILTTKRMVRQ